MRRAGSVAVAVLTLTWLLAPVPARGASPVLLRYPYLTDVVGSWAEVNLATDTQSPAPIVSWDVATGNCASPPNSVTAAYVTTFLTVDRQFKAELTGLRPNTAYCYRVTQAGVDLLGSAPVFTSALGSGAADPFTFAVIGDWGAGTTDESKVIGQIAAVQPSFIVTVGDNVYNSGTQTEYGDINGGNAFAPPYWPQVGRTIPAFPAEGNHGFSGNLPYFQNWPQDGTIAACAAAGCRYQRDTYCCTGTLGTSSYNYPSSWYAFDWGNSRFYILEGAWSDSTGAYQGDFQARWNGSVPGCAVCGAEKTWLAGDLAAHPAAHKFAFFHYPLYSDSTSQPSDSYLDGSSGLEGMLAANGVHIVFNGHAHDYERNLAQISGSPMVTYVTGGGGDALGGVSRHGAFDAYARAVFHFLKVSVGGSSVTVTPIDENGATFDVQTYNFGGSAPADDFSISASPGSVTTGPGGAVTSTISTAVVSGSAQTIALSASGLPAGATATFNPSGVTAGGAATLSIATNAATPAGGYAVTVTGTGSSATHSTTLTLNVSAPDDFSLAASPGSVATTAGGTVTSTISTAVVSGSAQTIALSASGVPAGATATFNPQTVTAGGASTLSITTSASTPAGAYSIAVTGAGTSVTHSTTLTLNVPAADDFSIAASPSSLTASQGATVATTISTAVVSGSAQTIALGASGLPAGATATFSPSTVTAGGTSALSIATAASTPSGTYAVTITGTGASATHSTAVSLTVTATGGSGPRFVQASGGVESASSTSLTATFATATQAGSLLVLGASVYSGATNQITRVTDSAGNSWSKVGAYCTSGHYSDGELWYAANANPTTSVTVTVATATVIAFDVMEFAGVATSNPLDVAAGASNVGTAADSGAAAPAATGDLAVVFVAGHGSLQPVTLTAAGFTAQPQQGSSNAGATPATAVTGFSVLAGTGAQHSTGTFGSSMYWSAAIALFKAA